MSQPFTRAKRESLAHYDRMIAEIKKRIEADPEFGKRRPDVGDMTGWIGEAWGSRDCALCRLFYTSGGDCNNCPMSILGTGCGSWCEFTRATTWDEWLEVAEVIRKEIASLKEAPDESH